MSSAKVSSPALHHHQVQHVPNEALLHVNLLMEGVRRSKPTIDVDSFAVLRQSSNTPALLNRRLSPIVDCLARSTILQPPDLVTKHPLVFKSVFGLLTKAPTHAGRMTTPAAMAKYC